MRCVCSENIMQKVENKKPLLPKNIKMLMKSTANTE